MAYSVNKLTFIFICVLMNSNDANSQNLSNITLSDLKVNSTNSSSSHLFNETLKSDAQNQNPYLSARNQAPGVAGIPILGQFLAPFLNYLRAGRPGAAYSPEVLAAARQRGIQPGQGLNQFGVLNFDNIINAGNRAQQPPIAANQGLLYGQPQVTNNNNNDAGDSGYEKEQPGEGAEEGQPGQDGQDPSQDPDLQQFQNLRGSNFPADLFPPGILSRQDLSDIQKSIEEQQRKEAEKQRQQEAEQEQPEDESNETESNEGGEGNDAETGKTTEEPHTGNERDAIGAIGNLNNRNNPYQNTPPPIPTINPLAQPPFQNPYNPINPLTQLQPPYSRVNPINPRSPITSLAGLSPDSYDRRYERQRPSRRNYPDYDYDNRPQRLRVTHREDEPINHNNYDRLADRSPFRRPATYDDLRPQRREDYPPLPRSGRNRIRFDDDDEVNLYRRPLRRQQIDSEIDYGRIRERLPRRRLDSSYTN